jgi:hypothetical protein
MSETANVRQVIERLEWRLSEIGGDELLCEKFSPHFGHGDCRHCGYSSDLHLIRDVRDKLTAQPAPSGWQQRIERLVSEAFGAGVEWGGAAHADERPKWEGAKAMAKNFIAECAWQNAVDALPPAPEGKAGSEIIAELRRVGYPMHMSRIEPDAKDALPPGPEVKEEK